MKTTRRVLLVTLLTLLALIASLVQPLAGTLSAPPLWCRTAKDRGPLA